MPRLLKGDVGRFVRMRYDDVGAMDGVIVGIDDNRKDFRWFPLSASETARGHTDYIIELGSRLEAKSTGLS